MVDLSRLLKKAFIADKQGLREVGTDKPDKEVLERSYGRGLKRPEGPEIKDRRVQNFFSSQNERPRSSTPKEYPSFKQREGFRMPSFGSSSSSSARPASMWLYVLFFIISLGLIYFKKTVGYQPLFSFSLSIIQGLIFTIPFLSDREHNKPQLTLVFIAVALDLFVANGLLGLWPESGIKGILIMYHVFTWAALSIVLFLMGSFEKLGVGEKLPFWAWLLIAFIFGYVLIYLIFPVLIQSPLAYQDETHAEYYNIAKEQLFGDAKTLQETKNSAINYLTCSFDAARGINYDKCLEEKRIIRFCEANFPTEVQNCIKQQKELIEQGNRSGVSGSVSDAIKQVTKVELKEDQFFPKKATELRTVYPIPLKIINPREQTFTAKAFCEFKKGKENVGGIISIGGQEVSEVQITSRQQEFLIGCQPSTDLNGRYTLDYNVVLSGMQTFSFLKRAFISKEISAEIRKQVEADNFKTSRDKASQGPAEFALLNFKFGTGAGTEPLVLVEDPISFSFAVEDVGSGAYKGEVLKVNSYNFHGLWERGFSIDLERIGDQDCLQGGELMLLPAQTKKRQPSELKRCFLTLPPDLQQLQKNEYKIETFVADLNYDYKITKSIPIEVTPLVAPTVCGNGAVEANEQCDDGNQINTDACTTVCKTAQCGDGFVNPDTEQCDDGNAVNGDGCSSNCQVEVVDLV